MSDSSTPESGQEYQLPQNDLSDIKNTISQLSEQINAISESVEGFSSEIEAIKNPPSAQPPPQGWKPKSWDEFPKLAEEKAREVLVKTFEQAQAQQQEQERISTEARQRVDVEFDNQLALLTGTGKIPTVKNQGDPNDPGRVARKELFGLGLKYNSPDLIAMADLRENLRQAGYTLDLADNNPKNFKLVRMSGMGGEPSGIPIGQTAPVGSSARTTMSGAKPTYKDIHGTSMDEMVRRFNQ